MKANAPTSSVWILGLVLGILGVAHYTHIQYTSEYNYYLLLAGFVLLAAGTTFKRYLIFLFSSEIVTLISS